MTSAVTPSPCASCSPSLSARASLSSLSAVTSCQDRFPTQTIELLRSLQDRAVFVCGITDRRVVEALDARGGLGFDAQRVRRPAADWTASIIDREQRDFLASFEERFVIDIDTLGATVSVAPCPDDAWDRAHGRGVGGQPVELVDDRFDSLTCGEALRDRGVGD